jgi:hypothetical protein
VSALFITIYILPQICEKAQLLLDFFDKLSAARMGSAVRKKCGGGEKDSVIFCWPG